jgi:hypothetical protein
MIGIMSPQKMSETAVTEALDETGGILLHLDEPNQALEVLSVAGMIGLIDVFVNDAQSACGEPICPMLALSIGVCLGEELICVSCVSFTNRCLIISYYARSNKLDAVLRACIEVGVGTSERIK